MILCSILFFISGVCYLTSSLIFAHDQFQRLKAEFEKSPAGLSRKFHQGEAHFKVAREQYVSELGALALGTVVMFIFCGCALILVDIGRMYRRNQS